MSSKRFLHLVKAPTINSSSLLSHIYCNSSSTNIFGGIMDVYYSDMMLLLFLYLCDLLAFGPITRFLEGCVISTIYRLIINFFGTCGFISHSVSIKIICRELQLISNYL